MIRRGGRPFGYFKKIWYIEQKRDKRKLKSSDEKRLTLNPYFTQKNNLPLFGLFRISKDLFEDDIRFIDSLEPGAKEWYKIQNHLEHKFLKLGLSDDESSNSSYNRFGEVDKNVTYSIEIHDF